MDSLCKQCARNIRGRRTFNVTDMQGNTFQLPLEKLPLFDAHWTEVDWISDNLYLFYALYHEHPQFRQLVIWDAKIQQLTEIWPYTFKYHVVDMDNQTIVLLFEATDDPNLPQSGIYRVSTNGNYERIGNQMFFRLIASSQIIGKGAEKAYHIKSDNSIILIGPALSGLSDVSSSPDKKWFFIDDFDEGRQRFTLYSDTYQPIKSWTLDDNLIDITWRPDSLGIFLFTRDNIYYLDIPSGEPRLLNIEVPILDTCDSSICKLPSFTWLP